MKDKEDYPEESVEQDLQDVIPTQEIDMEKSGPRENLQRQVSGPPYTVFSKGMKIWIIFLVSVSALISPFGATTFLPALNVLSDVLDITPTQVNISITTYMVRTVFHTILMLSHLLMKLDCSSYRTSIHRRNV